MEAWARWCYRHKLVVLVLWVGALTGVGAAGSAAGGDYANMFGIPGTDSTRAYERMAEVFQWGWGAELLGFGKEGPITAFLPVIMLSMLFGLSMGYQVFPVGRMHEE